MDFTNQDVELDGIDLTRDQLRVAFLRLALDAADTDFDNPAFTLAEPPWRLSAIARGAPGPAHSRRDPRLRADSAPIASAAARSRRAGSRASPTRPSCACTAYGEFRPMPKLTFALGVRGQYAWKPLLSFEEFSAGNYTTGRGYDPGAILGDRGFGSQLEVRYGSRIPATAKRAAIEGYAFWDHSRVGNDDRLVVLDQSNHLNSVGGGARVVFDRFALDAGLAIPLTRVGLDDKKPDPRFLISLTTRLWPWSYK